MSDVAGGDRGAGFVDLDQRFGVRGGGSAAAGRRHQRKNGRDDDRDESQAHTIRGRGFLTVSSVLIRG